MSSHPANPSVCERSPATTVSRSQTPSTIGAMAPRLRTISALELIVGALAALLVPAVGIISALQFGYRALRD